MTLDQNGRPTGDRARLRLDRRIVRSRILAGNWGAVALRSLFGIVFGLVALVSPLQTLLTLALVFAGYLFADGILGLVAAARAAQRHERWGTLLLEALLNVIVAVAAVLVPGGAVFAFVLVVAGWAIITGGLQIIAAFDLHGNHGAIWLGLSGLVSVIFGAMLIAAPMIGAVVLTWWLAVYAILFGIFLLAFALRLRTRHRSPPPVA